MRKFLEHTDLTKPGISRMRDKWNNEAYERMIQRRAREEERIGFTPSKFAKFMLRFSHCNELYQHQMAYLWKWMRSQQGQVREYTYCDHVGGDPFTETLILVGISVFEHRGIVVVYKTKYGKKEWESELMYSPMFLHFQLKNSIAGKWVDHK